MEQALYEAIKNKVRKYLIEMVKERGTNLSSLYHFTDVDNLPKIVNSGKLNLSSRQGNLRNGNYMSYTRHKSNLEGYAKAADCNVRIEIFPQALNSTHNGSISSFEFYSPLNTKKTAARHSNRFGAEGLSAKQKYINAKSDPLSKLGFDDEEYMNQAEESYESLINNSVDANRIIKRIDVCIPSGDISGYYTNDANILLTLPNEGNSLLNKVCIYDNWKDFNLQTENYLNLNEWKLRRKKRYSLSWLRKRIAESIINEIYK